MSETCDTLETTLDSSVCDSPYAKRLELLRSENLLRELRQVDPPNGVEILVNGKPAISFASNNYLGLADDPRLKAAAIEATERYGTGSASSRLISGTGQLVAQLEQAVAAWKQAEAALVFNSGYQANVSILQALLKPGDWVFCDAYNHASLLDGCLLSKARFCRYEHLDLADLKDQLHKAPADALKWIVTDSVFSMDGDYPDLAQLVELAFDHGAYLLVDEAHAAGLFGESRHSGLCEQFGISKATNLLQMGTFSKALGGFGAYVAGSQTLIDYLTNKARGLIYSTALPPAVLGAAFKAVEIVQSDSEPLNCLQANLAFAYQCLKEAGFLQADAEAAFFTPIIPVVVGDSVKAMTLSAQLLEAGYFVPAVRPPTVPEGQARLRISLSANHTQSQIEGLIQTLKQLRN